VKPFATARRRRLLFVAVIVALLFFPLLSSLGTRALVERSGTDVTATVVETPRKGDAYLVGFRLPRAIDPDQHFYSAEVDHATYDKATETKQITVRVLKDRPSVHRVEGEIRSNTQYVVMGVGILLVLAVGLWWARTGRRRPTVRIRAAGPVEPADAADVGTLERDAGADVYEAVGTVVSADDAQVVLELGQRHVVVTLSGHPNPVPHGSPARARGPVIG
jgi:hypothetical protein